MDKTKYILIAGASGFIGKNLVNYLLKKQYKVKVISRNIISTQKLFPTNVQCFSWEEITAEMLNSLNEQCGAVINLAGENIGNVRWNIKNRKNILDSRLNAVANLSNLVNELKNKPSVWMQASAIGYYGDQVLLPLDESGRMGSGFLAYVVSLWENKVKSEINNKTRLVRLRFGLAISEKEGFLNELIQRNGKIATCPGNGQNKVSWIHINDLCRAVEFILNADGIHGAVNIVSPKPERLLNIIYTVAKFKQSWIVIKIPRIIIQWVLGYQKTRELIMANQHIIPQKLQDFNFNFKYRCIEEVLE
jgi:uncharacterized protein (TIGR01777 family)